MRTSRRRRRASLCSTALHSGTTAPRLPSAPVHARGALLQIALDVIIRGLRPPDSLAHPRMRAVHFSRWRWTSSSRRPYSSRPAPTGSSNCLQVRCK
ncbi:hypothetical protein NDU88_001225 [Pleurodeles waltl]|uniref:Secreted protein n=1 Tax=Pleurodeles waltl TaxID=8319 RepID=A0AAV7SYW1_PLEWA|nr:hypothetical protein NDU88_001225 [Pleurodeles waltl]